MINSYFPPGTEIGSYVIELFLKQSPLGHSYLAADQTGRKYILTVFKAQTDAALENDIAVWASSRNPAIVSEIEFFSEPVSMAVSPYIPGLTLEEEKLAGFTLQPQEAADILLQAAAIREDLISRGASDNFLSLESFLLKPDKSLAVRRDDLFYGNFQTVYSKLADACFALVSGPVSGAELKKRFFEDPKTDFSVISTEFQPPPVQTKDRPVSRAGKKWLTAGIVLVLAVLFSAPAVLLYQARKKTGNPDIIVQTLQASHHSRGPVVHSGKNDRTVKTAQKETAETQENIPLSAPVKEAPKPVPRKPVRKIVPRRKVVRKAIPKPTLPPSPKTSDLVIQAVRRGSLQDLRLLIDRGERVDLKDKNGKTAMYYAASADWKAMIELLHKAGAKITRADINAAPSNSTRRYMLKLLAPARPVPRAVNAARPVIRKVIPRTNGWKRNGKNWNITLEHAILKARPARKKILVLFTAPDWCDNCRMLEKNVLSSADFRKVANQLEMVYINFPRKGKIPKLQRFYNEKLRRDLGAGADVPCVVILDHNGKKIGSITGYCPKALYIANLQRFLR